MLKRSKLRYMSDGSTRLERLLIREFKLLKMPLMCSMLRTTLHHMGVLHTQRPIVCATDEGIGTPWAMNASLYS